MEVIRCKDCKYQYKAFYPDKRMKTGGYTVVGCIRFGELLGYNGWGGQDEQFCSDAVKRDS